MNLSIDSLETVFLSLLRAGGQAIVIFILVALVIRVFGKKLEPRWHHALWSLVFIRLLLPVAPESAFSLFNLWPDGGFAPDAAELVVEAPLPIEEAGISTPETSPLATPIPASPNPQSRISWTLIAASIWLIGVVGFTLRFLLQVGKVRRRLRDRRDAPESSRRLLAEILSGLGMRRKARLQVTSAISGPAVTGLFRPVILIPSGLLPSLSDTELRHILLHELAHIRRRDLAVNWVLAVAQILHWCNPFAWIVRQKIREARESACDAWAIATLSGDQNRDYGRTVLKLLENQPAGPALWSPQLEAFSGHRAGMERRIRRISSNAYGSKRWAWLALAMILLLICVGLTDADQSSAARGLKSEIARLNLDFERGPREGSTYPSGWSGGGENYEISVDPKEKHEGNWSGRIQSNSGDVKAASLTSRLSPVLFAGKRIRLTGFLKLDDVEGTSGLWLRADRGDESTRPAFKTLAAQKINGTRGWRRYQLEIYIPEDVININFGAVLVGTGTLWADTLGIKVVGDAPSAGRAEPEPVAATVDGKPISRSAVKLAAGIQLNLFLKKNQKNTTRAEIESKRKEFENEALQDLIDRQLILHEFERMGGALKPEYVDKSVDQIIDERFAGDRSAFLKGLETQGLSLEKFRQTREEEIVIQAMRAQNIGGGEAAERQRAQDAWLKSLREKASIRYPAQD